MGLSVINSINIIVGLFMLLMLSPFILAYIIGVPIMILSPLILLGIGFINGFSSIGIGDILETVKGFVIGSFLAVLGYYVGKFFVKLMIKNLRWNISMAKGGINDENPL